MLQMLGLLVPEPLVPEKMRGIEFLELLKGITDLLQNIEMMIPICQGLEFAVDSPQVILQLAQDHFGLINLFLKQILFGNFGTHCVTLIHVVLVGRSHL